MATCMVKWVISPLTSMWNQLLGISKDYFILFMSQLVTVIRYTLLVQVQNMAESVSGHAI